MLGTASGRKLPLQIFGPRFANGADWLTAKLFHQFEINPAAGSGDIPAPYLGLALRAAIQLLMRAPMITTMGAALSAMARALRTIQLSVDVGDKGT